MSPVVTWLSRHPWGQYVAVAWLVLATGVIAWLIADRLGESDRAAAREAARARQQAVAFCTKTRSEALAPLTSRSTEFPRNDVRGAITAYRLGDCTEYLGEPLDLAKVDPEAFRPAPPVSP